MLDKNGHICDSRIVGPLDTCRVKSLGKLEEIQFLPDMSAESNRIRKPSALLKPQMTKTSLHVLLPVVCHGDGVEPHVLDSARAVRHVRPLPREVFGSQECRQQLLPQLSWTWSTDVSFGRWECHGVMSLLINVGFLEFGGQTAFKAWLGACC